MLACSIRTNCCEYRTRYACCTTQYSRIIYTTSSMKYQVLNHDYKQ